MNLVAALQTGIRSLRSNLLRSGLTALGIIIGVAAVLLMFALGTGASREIEKQIASIGVNLLLVLPGTTTSGGVRVGAGSTNTLTIQDSLAIKRSSNKIIAVAPVWGKASQIKMGNRNWSTAVRGSTPDMFKIRKWGLNSGRIFSEQELRSAAKVAVLGATVRKELFGTARAIGKNIRIGKVPFKVVGILKPKGPTPRGTDQDDVVYVPITTAQKRLFGTHTPGQVQAIVVQTSSVKYLEETAQKIRQVLRHRHRLKPGEDDDFSVRNLSEMMDAAKRSAKVMSALLGSVALISLVVGGIGVMNIMLVSVTERTREIGIRMAVGARPKDILLQFLIEAIILSVSGGLVGIAAGWSGKYFLQHTVKWPMEISLISLAVAFLFAVLEGIFFGLYPAWKASRLEPIEALRYG